MKRRQRRCALTIAGSDSGGGAGIQADLKTFFALGVHGTSAITCLTAQNPREVAAVEASSASMVRAQIESVWEELAPSAVKTGMLYSSAIIRIVAVTLRERRCRNLVVDPVMVSTSGARLLKPSAITVLCDELLPLARLLTPNLDEAELLAGFPIREPEDLRRAARELRRSHGCAVLMKGGHLPGPEAIDVFWDGEDELLLTSPRIRGIAGHGTGCTYAAAVAGFLALGLDLARAVVRAKEHVAQAIASSRWVGAHAVLGPWQGRDVATIPTGRRSGRRERNALK